MCTQQQITPQHQAMLDMAKDELKPSKYFSNEKDLLEFTKREAE